VEALRSVIRQNAKEPRFIAQAIIASTDQAGLAEDGSWQRRVSSRRATLRFHSDPSRRRSVYFDLKDPS
jgi:hypothetical protein